MISVLTAGRDAPVALRRRLAMTVEEQRALLRRRVPGVGEMAVLCTCHRTELYATSDGPESEVVHAVASLLALEPADHHDVRFLQGVEAVEHLFRVACGLDSLVVGEPQVLGQVRRALVMAQEENSAGPVLRGVFGRAIALGRRARTTGPLGRLGLSVGSIAAEHLLHRFGSLTGRRGAVVGAGEAASDAALALSKHGATLCVVSRTRESAERLAQQVGADAHTLGALGDVLARSEFAVVAVTGATAVREAHVPPGPFVIVDLSVPPSVEPMSREDVDVRSLEDLPGPRGPEVTEAIIDAESLVRKEVAELERFLETRSHGETIRALRARAEAIVRDEVARARLAPEDADRVSALAMRIANKLLHGPTVALREGDAAVRAAVERIFKLEWEE